MSYIDLNLESQDIKLKVIDNGDGTYSLATISVSGSSSSSTVSVDNFPTETEVSNLDEIVVPDTSSASNVFIVTPNDSADLEHTTRAIYVSSSGNMQATFSDSGTVVISGLLAGIVYPFNVKRIFSTGTTVVGILGLY